MQTIRRDRVAVPEQRAVALAAVLVCEELRLLYHLDDPTLAPAHVDAWLAWASRSRLAPFVRLARTLGAHRDGILAAIRLWLSNGRLEGLNSKIRLISHRSFGLHSAAALIELVYLCCAGVVIDLPPMTFTPKSTGAPESDEARFAEMSAAMRFLLKL